MHVIKTERDAQAHIDFQKKSEIMDRSTLFASVRLFRILKKFDPEDYQKMEELVETVLNHDNQKPFKIPEHLEDIAGMVGIDNQSYFEENRKSALVAQKHMQITPDQIRELAEKGTYADIRKALSPN